MKYDKFQLITINKSHTLVFQFLKVNTASEITSKSLKSIPRPLHDSGGSS